MKKFLLSMFLVFAFLSGLFVYVLYTEGFFETKKSVQETTLKPFLMKCEAGKCGGSEKKCGQ